MILFSTAKKLASADERLPMWARWNVEVGWAHGGVYGGLLEEVSYGDDAGGLGNYVVLGVALDPGEFDVRVRREECYGGPHFEVWLGWVYLQWAGSYWKGIRR